MTGPLNHIRVLELSANFAGPWAGQTLADLGATVIKVEKPGVGDDTRTFGPPFFTTSDGRKTEESAYFMSTNRGKRSVTIDFFQPEGRQLTTKLAVGSDVVIENFKVGSLSKFGLDYASLKAVNPGLIIVQLRDSAKPGPHRDKPGYDFMIQGTGGLMSVTGEPDERPGGGPVKVGVAVLPISSPACMRPSRFSARWLVAIAPDRDSRSTFHCSIASRDSCQPGDELSCHREVAAAHGKCPSEHRSLPGVRDQRWPRHPRGGKPESVRALLRTD